MDGYKFHFGLCGAVLFFGGGRQATYEKELRELREKLAKRQAYLEEGEVFRFLLGGKVTTSSKKEGIRYPK